MSTRVTTSIAIGVLVFAIVDAALWYFSASSTTKEVQAAFVAAASAWAVAAVGILTALLSSWRATVYVNRNALLASYEELLQAAEQYWRACERREEGDPALFEASFAAFLRAQAAVQLRAPQSFTQW